MSLQDILDHRHAVRHYDPAQPIDAGVVKKCIELASLAPTSSNMQLWEAFHVTDKTVLGKLAHACLDQRSARTAQQIVVFVTRQSLYKQHAKAILDAAMDDINRNSPEEKKEKTHEATDSILCQADTVYLFPLLRTVGTCAQGAGTMYRTFSSYHAAGERERCASLRT